VQPKRYQPPAGRRTEPLTAPGEEYRRGR